MTTKLMLTLSITLLVLLVGAAGMYVLIDQSLMSVQESLVQGAPPATPTAAPSYSSAEAIAAVHGYLRKEFALVEVTEWNSIDPDLTVEEVRQQIPGIVEYTHEQMVFENRIDGEWEAFFDGKIGVWLVLGPGRGVGLNNGSGIRSGWYFYEKQGVVQAAGMGEWKERREWGSGYSDLLWGEEV